MWSSPAEVTASVSRSGAPRPDLATARWKRALMCRGGWPKLVMSAEVVVDAGFTGSCYGRRLVTAVVASSISGAKVVASCCLRLHLSMGGAGGEVVVRCGRRRAVTICEQASDVKARWAALPSSS